jgi:hypothetical protein
MGLMWIFPLLFFVVLIGMMGVFWRRGLGAGCAMKGDHRPEVPRQILDRLTQLANSRKSNMTRCEGMLPNGWLLTCGLLVRFHRKIRWYNYQLAMPAKA